MPTTRPSSRVILAIALAALALAAPHASADSASKQASEQLKYGTQAARRGYWLEALDRYRRANEYTPNEPRILNNIAVALEAAGRFSEALVTYEAAIAIAPNDRVLRSNYSLFKEFYEEQLAPPEPEPTPAAEPAPEAGAGAETPKGGDDVGTAGR